MRNFYTATEANFYYKKYKKELLDGREDNNLTEEREDYLLDELEKFWYYLSNEDKEAESNAKTL